VIVDVDVVSHAHVDGDRDRDGDARRRRRRLWRRLSTSRVAVAVAVVDNEDDHVYVYVYVYVRWYCGGYSRSGAVAIDRIGVGSSAKLRPSRISRTLSRAGGGTAIGPLRLGRDSTIER
jgi:hypothetical protein